MADGENYTKGEISSSFSEIFFDCMMQQPGVRKASSSFEIVKNLIFINLLYCNNTDEAYFGFVKNVCALSFAAKYLLYKPMVENEPLYFE